MASTNFKISWVLLFVLVYVCMATSADLSSNFYEITCPNYVADTVTFVVNAAIAGEPRLGASLLRLHFHDCFVNGCDGSVLLDDTANLKGEKTAPPNANFLRVFYIIDTIKSILESVCPSIVSCADIIALAARDSVVTLGGPSWEVPLGRRDSTTANFTGTRDIPSPFQNLTQLVSAFKAKGFTMEDMVALSGAHTIGQAKCRLFRTRLYNESNINPSLATSLKSICPSSGGDNNVSPLDVTTPTSFDNAYFNNLVNQNGVLHSDQQLFSGGATDSQVNAYVSNPESFRTDFANAMVKMGNLGPLTGSQGQIRTNCRRVN